MYTDREITNLRAQYPVGCLVEVYDPFARKEDLYTVRASGSVVAHNDQGVIVDVINFDRGNKEESRALKPGHDRFSIVTTHGESLTDLKAAG